VMIAASPIRGSSGETIAALAFYIDAFGTFSGVTQLGHMGESGEAYAVDHAGQMVTRSRFKGQTDSPGLTELRDPAGDPAPFTRMARSVQSGESGVDLDGYRDYRGNVVVGAWLWDQELG